MDGAYGWTPPTYRLIFLDPEIFEWDTRLYTAIVLHEVVHSSQRLWVFSQNYAYEAYAYEIESDFLKSVGIEGTTLDLKQRFPNVPSHFFDDEALQMSQHGLENPAIHE